jgi:hypothetical protein
MQALLHQPVERRGRVHAVLAELKGGNRFCRIMLAIRGILIAISREIPAIWEEMLAIYQQMLAVRRALTVISLNWA